MARRFLIVAEYADGSRKNALRKDSRAEAVLWARDMFILDDSIVKFLIFDTWTKGSLSYDVHRPR